MKMELAKKNITSMWHLVQMPTIDLGYESCALMEPHRSLNEYSTPLEINPSHHRNAGLLLLSGLNPIPKVSLGVIKEKVLMLW
jgi:hypothetical protein